MNGGGQTFGRAFSPHRSVWSVTTTETRADYMKAFSYQYWLNSRLQDFLNQLVSQLPALNCPVSNCQLSSLPDCLSVTVCPSVRTSHPICTGARGPFES